MKTIRGKLFLSFGIIIALLIVQLVVGKILSASAQNTIEQAVKVDLKASELAQKIKMDIVQVQQSLNNISTIQGTNGYNNGLSHAEKYAKMVNQKISELKKLVPSEKDDLDKLKKTFNLFYNQGKMMAQVYIDKGAGEGNKQMDKFDAVAEKMENNLASNVSKFKNAAAQSINNAIDTNKSAFEISIIMLVIILITSLFAGLFLSKNLSTSVGKLIDVTNEVARGNTKVNVKIDTKDELNRLGNSFNEMIKEIDTQKKFLAELPAPVMIINPDFSIKYINDQVGALIGKSPDEAVGLKCYDQMQTKDCNTENCALKQAMKLDKRVVRTTDAKPMGNEIPIQYTGQPVKNEKGTVIGAIEYIMDLTEAKEKEKYLETNTEILLENMERFAKGDLTVKLENKDENDLIGKLFKGFNLTVQNLRTMTNQIKDAIEATASASTQISSSAEQMAAGAQEQSSQTAEVASAMEEMTSTIVETNKNTNLAAEAVSDSGTLAQEGGKAVEDTIHGMENIAEVVVSAASTVKKLGEDSEKIGEIINVINEIADQTNLLALNAAIEAARAGEQGRGFAVVADEVRKLAERTTGATKEIAEMITKLQEGTTETVISIEKGVHEVERGKEIAERSGKSMNEIVISSTRAMDLVTQVATASEEQSATSEEVSKNIEGINLVAQETAIGVEQIAIASEDLNRLTENLQGLIEQFNLDGEQMGQQHLDNNNGDIGGQLSY